MLFRRYTNQFKPPAPVMAPDAMSSLYSIINTQSSGRGRPHHQRCHGTRCHEFLIQPHQNTAAPAAVHMPQQDPA